MVIRIDASGYPSLKGLIERLEMGRDRDEILARVSGVAELRRLTESLAAQGVTAVVLKGYSTALYVYSDPFSRKMNDIDLLVRPEEFRDAVSCLTACGYTLVKKYSDVATLRANVSHEVEVHTHPFSRLFYGEGTDHFIDRSVTLSIGNFQFRALCREDLFLELCVHLYAHMSYYRQAVPARWLHELHDACLVLGPSLEREHVNRDIGAYRLSRPVSVALTAARTHIPEGLLLSQERGLHSALVSLCESPHVPKMGGLFAALSALLYGKMDVHRRFSLLHDALMSGVLGTH